MATGGEGQVDCRTTEAETQIPQETTDALTWDQYFMGVALIAAQRSMHPNPKVGACIVNPNKRIVGIGYNGVPDIGDKSQREQEPDPKKMKPSSFACHAETNAIVKKIGADIQDCTLYTTLYPCNECSKLMIQSGIKKVVHLEDADLEKDTFVASKKLLETANIKIKKYQPKCNKRSLIDELEKL